MHQRTLNQWREGLTLVKIFLPVAKDSVQLRGRWRYVHSLIERSSRGANPVLTAAKFSRRLFLAAHTFEKLGMHFPHEPQAQWQLMQTL